MFIIMPLLLILLNSFISYINNFLHNIHNYLINKSNVRTIARNILDLSLNKSVDISVYDKKEKKHANPLKTPISIKIINIGGGGVHTNFRSFCLSFYRGKKHFMSFSFLGPFY